MDIVFEGNFVDTYTMKGTVHRVPGGRDGSWHAKRDMIHSAEIHKAAENGDVEQVRTLLGENPDLVFSKDDAGRTPLLAAAFNGNKDILGLLLANKANIHDTDIFGYTPLHRAAWEGTKTRWNYCSKTMLTPTLGTNMALLHCMRRRRWGIW